MKKFKIKNDCLNSYPHRDWRELWPYQFCNWWQPSLWVWWDEIFWKVRIRPDKEKFIKAVEKSGADSLFEIHRFIKQHKNIAKQTYINKVQVSSGISKAYEEKIGKVVQIEKNERPKKGKGMSLEDFANLRGVSKPEVDVKKIFNQFADSKDYNGLLMVIIEYI